MRIFSITIVALLTLCTAQVDAQEKKARKSPMKTTEATVGEAQVTITYSSPSVKGRTIFGDLVKFDKVWRTGANEATTFETTDELTVGGEKVAAGKYSLFTIPGKDQWTIIINSEAEQWGVYKYDASKDVARISTDKIDTIESVEAFEITVENGMLSFAWSTTKVSVSIK